MQIYHSFSIWNTSVIQVAADHTITHYQNSLAKKKLLPVSTSLCVIRSLLNRLVS